MHNQVSHMAFFVLETSESTGTPNIPQSSRRENVIKHLTAACETEVIRSYKGSAQPLFSLS